MENNKMKERKRKETQKNEIASLYKQQNQSINQSIIFTV